MAQSKASAIFFAVLVRLVLILHNCLCVWRVSIVYKSNGFWGMAAANVFLLAEGAVIVYYNNGVEWKWWCPCFLFYLLTTFPSIWMLQIGLYNDYIEGLAEEAAMSSLPVGSAAIASAQLAPGNASTVTMTSVNMTYANGTTGTTTPVTTTNPEAFPQQFSDFIQLGDDVWIVVVMESLIYLLVFSRWLLPRGEVSRDALAELLLEFLAIASDIMELLAVFDEDTVRGNLGLTYAILVIWSLSFFQFVPVLVHKHKYRHLQSPRMRRISRACGDAFSEVVVTFVSIFMQDGPFLCLRLYIMLNFQLITYSLVFFVLKNIVTLLLLFYRLAILCVDLPCCFKDEAAVMEVDSVDFSRSVSIDKPRLPLRMRTSMNGTLTNSDISAFPYIIGAKA